MAGRRDQGRATIIDVARAASVSPQTVSNVVNAPHKVRPETRERVSREISRLGFRASRAARTLRQERAGGWGLQLTSGLTPSLSGALDEFHVHLTAGSRKHDSYVVPFVAPDPADEVAAYDDLIASRIADGFVLTNTRRDDPRPGHLLGRGIPFASFGRIWDDPDLTRWVDVDGAAGCEEAVRHLAAGGFERIGFLGWPAGSPVGDDRRSGWARATADLGVARPDWAVETLQDLGLASRVAAPIIDELGRGGALVCASDLLAVGAWEVLSARGWRIGTDFGLVGFDDSALAASLRLTSLRQPLAAAAEHALDLLGSPEEATPEAGVLLAPELVVRTSSTPAETRTDEGSTT